MSSLRVTFMVCLSALALNLQDAHSLDRQAQPCSQTLAVAVDGLERSAIVHVPAAYTPQRPSPLVVMLHGGGGTAKAALWETEWAVKAEKEGFLVAFPNARARDPAQPSSFAGNPQLWNDGSDRFYPGQKAPDDVSFIAAMLDELCAGFAIDRRRVFITGFSNGASMSFRVGAELSHRIAAIAPVAGALWFDPPGSQAPGLHVLHHRHGRSTESNRGRRTEARHRRQRQRPREAEAARA
jgi:polyhydroxybutyrate depolymerase